MTQREIDQAFIRRVERITGMPTSADAVGERELEDVRAEAELWLGDSEATALYDLLRELDALRAKLAEVEGQRDEYEHKGKLLCCDYGNALMDTARAQAEARALREALANYGAHGSRCSLYDYRGGRTTEDGGYEWNYGGVWRPTNATPPCSCGWHAALATPPGDDAALREVCRRAWKSGRGLAEDASHYAHLSREDVDREMEYDINGLLGQPDTDASEGGGA